MDENNKINAKIVKLLNDEGYKQSTLSSIDKTKLKSILQEVYREFGSLGNVVMSQNKVWKKAAEEVIKEHKENERDNHLDKNEDSDEKNDYANEIQEDKNLNSKDYGKDYDDLIQPEFPNEYIDSIHAQRILKLAEQLEQERNYEVGLRNNCNKNIRDAISKKSNNYNNNNNNNNNNNEEGVTNNKLGGDKIEDETSKEIMGYVQQMKEKIKENKYMKNDEFLLLLCLMRKRKEKLFENNPYIVDFSVNIDTVYQIKGYDDVNNKKNEDNTLLIDLEEALNGYVK